MACVWKAGHYTREMQSYVHHRRLTVLPKPFDSPAAAPSPRALPPPLRLTQCIVDVWVR